MFLNLAEKNPSRLLTNLQTGLEDAVESLRIDLLGPGVMVHDTALMLYHELRSRPSGLRVHVHSHTCLLDGAVLLWLAGDTRSIRPDAWIQIGHAADCPQPAHVSSNEYPTAVALLEESPAETDLRTIHRHLGEFLPVSEISGLRIFAGDLAELNLLSMPGDPDPLAALFQTPPRAGKAPRRSRKTPKGRRRGSVAEQGPASPGAGDIPGRTN